MQHGKYLSRKIETFQSDKIRSNLFEFLLKHVYQVQLKNVRFEYTVQQNGSSGRGQPSSQTAVFQMVQYNTVMYFIYSTNIEVSFSKYTFWQPGSYFNRASLLLTCP